MPIINVHFEFELISNQSCAMKIRRGGHEKHFTKNAAQQSSTIFRTLKTQFKLFYFLKCSTTFTTNLVI